MYKANNAYAQVGESINHHSDISPRTGRSEVQQIMDAMIAAGDTMRRMQSEIDRICGVVPQPVNNNSEASYPDGVMPVIAHEAAALERMAKIIMAEMDRLTRATI